MLEFYKNHMTATTEDGEEHAVPFLSNESEVALRQGIEELNASFEELDTKLTNKLGYVIQSTGGMSINHADGNAFYSDDLNINIPPNAILISAIPYGSYTTGLTCIIRNRNAIALQCTRSIDSLPSNRNVICTYTIQ